MEDLFFIAQQEQVQVKARWQVWSPDGATHHSPGGAAYSQVDVDRLPLTGHLLHGAVSVWKRQVTDRGYWHKTRVGKKSRFFPNKSDFFD